MKILPLILLLAGCTTWQTVARQSLTWAHGASKGAERVALPYFKAKCEGVAHKCHAAKDTVCKPLVDCQGERSKLQYILDNVDRSIMMAYTAVLLANEKTWDMQWHRILGLVADANALLQELEILK